MLPDHDTRGFETEALTDVIRALDANKWRTDVEPDYRDARLRLAEQGDCEFGEGPELLRNTVHALTELTRLITEELERHADDSDDDDDDDDSFGL